jgi:hypothetical protein
MFPFFNLTLVGVPSGKISVQNIDIAERVLKGAPKFWLMTNLTHTFSMYLFHASTCFEQQVLIIRRTNLCQYIIWCNTLWWVTDVPVLLTGTSDSHPPKCVIPDDVLTQVVPPDDEHLLLETCRGMK